jgi:hypothetical protein
MRRSQCARPIGGSVAADQFDAMYIAVHPPGDDIAARLSLLVSVQISAARRLSSRLA